MDDTASSRGSKFLIVTMLLVGVGLAGFSWWFRFTATHRAAQFWGPTAVRLIQDAPRVEAYRWTPEGDVEVLGRRAEMREASRARGMVHLRNALLEDQSYQWEQTADPAATENGYALRFGDDEPAGELWLMFSPDFQQVRPRDGAAVATTPIAGGLEAIFSELFSTSSAPASTAPPPNN